MKWQSTLVFCALGLACDRYKEPIPGTGDVDSSSFETGDTQPADQAFRGMIENTAVLVIDGTRIEESFGDKTTWGAGYSDAYGGPTEEIMPLIREHLLPKASIAKPGYVTGITVTTPAHVDMMTGGRRAFGHFSTDDGAARYRPDLPNLFEALRAKEGLDADQVIFSANTVHMKPLDFGNYPGMGEEVGGTYVFIHSEGDKTASEQYDGPVMDDVQAHLEGGARLVVANLHGIDRSGHYNANQHHTFITDMDDDITEFWQDFVQADGSALKDETLLVVASDHGRHRFIEGDTPWQHHNCACSGCREVPMLLMGPGVRQGYTATVPFVFEDIALTVAWLMDFELPYGEGMVMTEFLTGSPEVQQRSGPARLHASGDLLAYQQWRQDFASRSQIVADGEVFADEAALHMEEPRVLSTEFGDYLFWRQVTVATDDEYWSWEPKIRFREPGGAWNEVPVPEEQVWPYFKPGISVDAGGRLFMAYSANTNGIAETDKAVYLLRYVPSRGWEGLDANLPEHVYFPTHPSIIAEGETSWLAYGSSSVQQQGQGVFTRDVNVFRVDWPADGDISWSNSYHSPETDAAKRAFSRMENPALHMQDGTLHLAYHGFNDDGNYVLATQLDDPAGEWSSTRTIDTSGDVFVHVPLAWSASGQLHWARQGSDGDAEVCRASAKDISASDCVSVGVPYLESLAAGGDKVWASVSAGERQWELQEVNW